MGSGRGPGFRAERAARSGRLADSRGPRDQGDSAAMAYLSRLRRSWLWSPAAALWMMLGWMPLLFFQTTIHESSHCLMLEVTGIGCRLMAPFPLALQHGFIHGGTIPADDSSTPPVAVFAAPQVLATVLIVALRLVSPRVNDERMGTLTRLWLFGACIDLLANTTSGGPSGDWSTTARELGLSASQRLAVSGPLWVVAFWGLFAPVPTSFARTRARVGDLWEIGAVYALVSATAVVVSLAVQVPETNPGSLWHRVPILLHAVTVVVCLAILAASRLTRRETA